MKPIRTTEQDDWQSDPFQLMSKPAFIPPHFKNLNSFQNLMYFGSQIAWGITSIGTKTVYNTQCYVWGSSAQSLFLRTHDGSSIDIPCIFSIFYHNIERFPNLAKIQYYTQQSNPKTNKQVKQKYEFSKKTHLKKTIQIRMDIYLNRDIFNEKNSTYSEMLQKIDRIRTQLYTIKRDTEQYNRLSNQLSELEADITMEKRLRGLIMFLMEKTRVKVINRSFVKPPPKLNYMMRCYRKLTIGIITKNKRYERIQRKIERWKKIFRLTNTTEPCIRSQLDQKYYDHVPKNLRYIWGEKYTKNMQEKFNLEKNKLLMRNNSNSPAKYINMRQIQQARKKLMEQMGATGFDSDDSDEGEGQQGGNQNSQLMKKNQALMQRFQKQNKHFRQHTNPPSMISQLKTYQKQALQWMKYRQSKISVQQLFDEQYLKQIQQFEYQRKLSPFWEEVQLINNQKFYLNYLTGQFTQKFHQWKSIKGGILADQMGLGKTVMTLSLLADQQFQGLNLIVVPVAVLVQWREEIFTHCGSDIKVFQFHSNSKDRRKIDLNQYNIVLITYATLGNQYKSYSKNYNEKVKYIFDYKFKRVILDEAHNIKGIKTLQFSGVMQLKSMYSWCLTGTLIQNSQQDLFAIFKFLRVQVFSQEAWWNQYIKNAGCTQAKLNVIQTVLRPIVLRRTKASTSHKGEAILKLKQKNETIIRPEFTDAQQKIYKKLQQGVRSYFKNSATSGRNYTHVFQIICKLRQFCCHPALVFGVNANQIDENDISKALDKFLQNRVSGKFKDAAIQTLLESGTSCIICMQQPPQDEAALTECGHFFCEKCIIQSIKKQNACPLCRTALTLNSFVKKQDFKAEVPKQIKQAKDSSKLIAIFKIIQQIRQRKQKCVIFTQWMPIIGIIEKRMTQKGIKYGTIKGDLHVKKRQAVIEKFRNQQQCEFLIVSIRAGGVGLNLAFANNVMICDPWWNPSQQDQAIGRVHRFGQEKDVNVYRFYMKNSIQEKIEKMHQTKKKLANQVMMEKGSLRDKKQGATDQLMRLLQ